MTQKCFPGLKPIVPTIRTPSVARRIAERIVAAVNLDDFYWTPSEVPDRIEDVAAEIVRCGRPATVIDRLHRKSPWVSDERRERVTEPWGWDGINNHCRDIADGIAEEELDAAIERYRWEFGE